MLFRPSYCAKCGEKIEREEWHFWTSRRFCIVCESEYRGTDLIPQVIVVLGILGTVIGFGGYIRSSSNSVGPQAVRQLKGGVEKAAPADSNIPTAAMAPAAVREPVSPPVNADLAAKQPATAQSTRVANTDRGSADGPIYICGAQTKKGTPCSRRVKGNVRCFQHTGVPAMLPPEKLRVG